MESVPGVRLVNLIFSLLAFDYIFAGTLAARQMILVMKFTFFSFIQGFAMFSRFFSGLLLCLASFASHAAGPLEGVYQWENGGVFYSVSQNDSGLLIGRFRTESAVNLGSQLGGTNVFRAKQFDTYTLYSGAVASTSTVVVSGVTSTIATYNVVGETNWGACTTTLGITFTTPAGGAPSGQIAVVGSVPTTYGITTLGTQQLAAAECQAFIGKALGLLAGPVTTERIIKLR